MYIVSLSLLPNMVIQKLIANQGKLTRPLVFSKLLRTYTFRAPSASTMFKLQLINKCVTDDQVDLHYSQIVGYLH